MTPRNRRECPPPALHWLRSDNRQSGLDCPQKGRSPPLKSTFSGLLGLPPSRGTLNYCQLPTSRGLRVKGITMSGRLSASAAPPSITVPGKGPRRPARGAVSERPGNPPNSFSDPAGRPGRGTRLWLRECAGCAYNRRRLQ